MTEVERQYRAGIARWSGQQRVERAAALFEEMRSILARKVEASNPGLDRDGVRRRVAECLYRTDREAQRLLARLDR